MGVRMFRHSTYGVSLGAFAALVLIGSSLMTMLPAKSSMASSRADDMSIQCPNCQVASACSDNCLLGWASPAANLARPSRLSFEMPQQRLLPDSLAFTLP